MCSFCWCLNWWRQKAAYLMFEYHRALMYNWGPGCNPAQSFSYGWRHWDFMLTSFFWSSPLDKATKYFDKMLFLVSLWGCYWKRIEFDSIGGRMIFPCFRWAPSNPLMDKIEKLKRKCGGRPDYLSWIWDFILSWPWTWELLVFSSLGPPGLHQPLLCKGLGLWVEVMPSCTPHFRLKMFHYCCFLDLQLQYKLFGFYHHLSLLP